MVVRIETKENWPSLSKAMLLENALLEPFQLETAPFRSGQHEHVEPDCRHDFVVQDAIEVLQRVFGSRADVNDVIVAQRDVRIHIQHLQGVPNRSAILNVLLRTLHDPSRYSSPMRLGIKIRLESARISNKT